MLLAGCDRALDALAKSLVHFDEPLARPFTDLPVVGGGLAGCDLLLPLVGGSPGLRYGHGDAPGEADSLSRARASRPGHSSTDTSGVSSRGSSANAKALPQVLPRRAKKTVISARKREQRCDALSRPRGRIPRAPPKTMSSCSANSKSFAVRSPKRGANFIDCKHSIARKLDAPLN
jgi:hypothetical protein